MLLHRMMLLVVLGMGLGCVDSTQDLSAGVKALVSEGVFRASNNDEQVAYRLEVKRVELPKAETVEVNPNWSITHQRFILFTLMFERRFDVPVGQNEEPLLQVDGEWVRSWRVHQQSEKIDRLEFEVEDPPGASGQDVRYRDHTTLFTPQADVSDWVIPIDLREIPTERY